MASQLPFLPWDVFAGSSLGEESAEAVVPSSLVGWHHTVGLKSVLQTVQLPARIAHLATGLSNVYRDAFPHFELVQIKQQQMGLRSSAT